VNFNAMRGLQESSVFDFALKGRGFSRAVRAAKSIAALAAEGRRGSGDFL